MKRRGGLSLIVAVALLALPASTSAATTFGADLTQSIDLALTVPCTSTVGQACSFFTLTKTSGATETGSPIDGVLTSVRVRSANPPVVMAVRVLRAQPSPPFTFLNVGPETLISLPAISVVGGGQITEAKDLVHHPISAGDRLGLGWTQPSGGAVFVNASNGATPNCGKRQGTTGAHPVDTAATYSNASCQFEMLVQGTVEPDADHDGFGDETQDQCPTLAVTRAPCPTTVSPPHKRCKKHKKRAATTAKKCKKKRR